MKDKKLDELIPNEYVKDIHAIDYERLYSLGKKLILFDLDNTLADYDTPDASKKLVTLFDAIKKRGSTILILSNNSHKRVRRFAHQLEVKGIYRLGKPATRKIKKYLKSMNYTFDEMVWIGDQIITDVRCAKKLNIYAILVDPIKPQSERWYTKINRLLENDALKKIKERRGNLYNSLKLNER